ALTADFTRPAIAMPGTDGDELTDGWGVWLAVVGATEGVACSLALGCTLGTGGTSTVSHGTLRNPPLTAAPTASTATSSVAATSRTIAFRRWEWPDCRESSSNRRSAKPVSREAGH